MKTSSRLAAVQPSLTLEITSKAKQMAAAGLDVVSFAAGEPDFAPPKAVLDAACAAIHAGEGKYTAAAGAPALRRAIAARFAKDHGFHYEIDEVIVSSGAKQAIFNAIYSVADAGDEIIIPTPYWTSYPEMALAHGVQPVFLATSAADDFALDAGALERLITPRTRALILNSPNNPTGAVIGRGELEAIAAVLREREIWIISDDIYDRLVFPGHSFENILDVAPELRDRTIIVNGLSKTYCMTGWRVGYAAGPRKVIRSMETIQGHSTSCANAIAQIAATVALTEVSSEHIDAMVREYERRARAVHSSLAAIPGLHLPAPCASFYAFPTVSAAFGRRYRDKIVSSSLDLCRILLEDYRVAVVPGEAFGCPEALRISYATSMDEIERGLARIAEMFAALSG
jgi:aspartate aminotransferase